MNLREGRIGVREGISIAAIAMCTSGLLTFDTKNTYACGNAAYITLPVGGIIALVFFIIVLAAMRRSGAKNLSELILSAFGGTIGTAVTLVLMLCLLAAAYSPLSGFIQVLHGLFFNGIGYGIDGYCCEVGDELRKKSNGKPVNYTSIAIKGLLYAFKPTDATVIVDGVEKRYKKVWIAPTMNGRFYGGGMIAAPDQRRNAPDGKFSVVVWHGSNKLKTLVVFPSIFKGEHVKHSECIDIIKADEVTVRFDKPCALQIDGETILNVTEYSAKSSARVKAEKQQVSST